MEVSASSRVKSPSSNPPFKSSGRIVGLFFTLAVFTSAALLFVVEPMFGKMVLPLLGGSPAVWTTCMLFFQGALLLGYLYAHVGPRWLGLRRHAQLHIILLGLCLLALPISISATGDSFRLVHPALWLLGILSLSLGAPFVLLSSTGPLLQVWFSNTTHPHAENPYFLYAASNAGSLIALLSYPCVIEPLVHLKDQSRLWSLGYFVLVIVVGVSAAQLRPRPGAAHPAKPSTDRLPVSTRTKLRWITLAFVPSSFFLALTTYLTTDVAAVPLMWVVPLVLYLLSFTIVFGRRTILRQDSLLKWQPLGLITLAILDFWGPSASSLWLLPLHLLVFFMTALVCHGELAATRPPAANVTDFYLCLAVGGVLGGIFNAVIAPTLFDAVLEYPITLLLACAVRPSQDRASASRRPWLDAALIGCGWAALVSTRAVIGDRAIMGAVLLASMVAAVVCLRMSGDPLRFALSIGGILVAGIIIRRTPSGTVLRERNFFGVREVRDDARHQMRVLLNGTTKHGAQSTDPARRREPASYYYRGGPLGDVFTTVRTSAAKKVAVIGLGTGGMAAYAVRGQEWTFYEIDPDIARLARDSGLFTYLQDSPAKTRIILGDGRLSIATAPAQCYDIIVLDAFSSDAIPIHLLTQEALAVYREKLSPNGIMVFHLSNRYLNLQPVLGRLVQATGLFALIKEDMNPPKEALKAGGDPSVWAAVALNPAALGRLQDTPGWKPLRTRKDVALWTDDFSNIFRVFVWPHANSGRTATVPTKAGGSPPQ